MNRFGISSRSWTIGIAAAVLCAGLAWSHRAAAISSVTSASAFASVGLTAGQTLRVSLTNFPLVTPVAARTVYLPRAVQVTFFGADGSTLQQSTVTVTPNQTGSVDLDGGTLATAGRTQVRAEVQLLATPVAAQKSAVPFAFGQIAASEEVFDTTTGQTTVLNPAPQTVLPVFIVPPPTVSNSGGNFSARRF